MQNNRVIAYASRALRKSWAKLPNPWSWIGSSYSRSQNLETSSYGC
jgi:hypothetical protein